MKITFKGVNLDFVENLPGFIGMSVSTHEVRDEEKETKKNHTQLDIASSFGSVSIDEKDFTRKVLVDEYTKLIQKEFDRNMNSIKKSEKECKAHFTGLLALVK